MSYLPEFFTMPRMMTFFVQSGIHFIAEDYHYHIPAEWWRKNGRSTDDGR